jgi:hypothetical protein
MDMEDVKQLLTPLLSLLDGTHDVPFPKDKGKGSNCENGKIKSKISEFVLNDVEEYI